MSVLKKIMQSRKQHIPGDAWFKGKHIEKNSRDFRAAIAKPLPGRKALIAELKRKSPSKGELRPDFTPEQAVQLYSPYAQAMSVLTEPEYFGGSNEDLQRVFELTPMPLLRKDFLSDIRQIKEARYLGASACLLIVAALDKNQLLEMQHAITDYNMTALTEVHDEKELEIALEAGADTIGINNRNLNDLSINLNTTHRLMQRIPSHILKKLVVVAESGYDNRESLLSLPAQISAVLIGTAFTQATIPENKIKEMFG
jgi:indole-3-glycerol phosphate synthase